MKKLSQKQAFNFTDLKKILLSKHQDKEYTETWELSLQQQQPGLYVDLIQTLRSDNNKWQESQVVTDKVLRRYLFSQTMVNLGLDVNKLVNYVQKGFTKGPQNFDLQGFQELAQKTKLMQVSLPYGYKIPREPRKFKTSFLPVIVKVDNYDLSYPFADYEKYGSQIVERTFDSLLSGNNPELQNNVYDQDLITEFANRVL